MQPIGAPQAEQPQIDLLPPQQPIQTAVETIRRLNDQMQAVLDRNEANRLFNGVRERRDTRTFVWWGNTLLGGMTAGMMLIIAPIISHDALITLLPTFYSNRLFRYLINNANQPWAQDIIQLEQSIGEELTPMIFFSRIQLVCQTATATARHFGFETRLPSSISPGIPLSAAGLIFAGVALGIGGSALMGRFGWREMPMTFREFSSLFTHYPNLLDYQERQGGENELDVEMQNLVEQVEPEVVTRALTQGERLVSEQLKAYAYNSLYTISWPLIGLTLWGLYCAGIARFNHLQDLNTADFDSLVSIPSFCRHNATINMTYFHYEYHPVPGGMEYLHQLRPHSAPESLQENIKNVLTIPPLVFALLPLVSGLFVTIVLGIIRCARTPQPAQQQVQAGPPVQEPPAEVEAEVEVGCAAAAEPVPQPENETNSDRSSSSSDQDAASGDELD